MQYKLAPIILTSQQKNSKVCEVYISQPDSNKEALAGKAFVLAEIDSHKSDAIKIIDFLINYFNNNYYNNEKILLRERISSLKIEHIFESVLTKLNKELEDLVSEKKIKINFNDVNLLIGIVHENNLYFASYGNIKALLIYKNTDEKPRLSNSEPEYKTINIINYKDVAKEKSVEQKKLFSNVISGKIPKKGFVLFANEALPEYLSNRQLVDVITKLSPGGAAEQIKNILANVNSYVSFLGIIIKNTIAQAPSVETARSPLENSATRAGQVEAQKSISSLQSTEQATERLLAPSGLINIKSWLNALGSRSDKILNKLNIKKTIKSISLKDKIFVSKKPSFLSWTKFISFLKNILLFILHFTVLIFRTLTDKKKLFNFFKSVKSFFISLIKNIWKIKHWFLNLQKKHQILIAGLCLIVIIFTVSLIFTDSNNTKQQAAQNSLELVEKIQQRQNQIDANLLYNNNSRAKDIIDEVALLLKQLPEEYKLDQAELFSKHDSQLEKIQHFIPLENLQEITDFSKLNSQAQTENIIMLKNKLYGGDSKNKTIYSLDLKENTATAITDMNNTLDLLQKPVIIDEDFIFYINGDKTIALDTSNDALKNISLAYPSGANTASASSYGNRIYLLDKANNQIYRYTFSNDNISNATAWLSSQADFSNSQSLAIDGNVYVLNSNGQILNYFSGNQEDFNSGLVEPNITSADKIVTLADWKYIYVMESENKRIVVFDKKGAFVAQYKSDKFDSIKDIVVDEPNKTLYVLNNNSVYKALMAHAQ